MPELTKSEANTVILSFLRGGVERDEDEIDYVLKTFELCALGGQDFVFRALERGSTTIELVRHGKVLFPSSGKGAAEVIIDFRGEGRVNLTRELLARTHRGGTPWR